MSGRLNNTRANDRIVELFANTAGLDPTEVDPRGWALAHGIDSLGLVLLREEVEAAFDITIPDEVWLEFQSIAELAAYVSHTNGNGSGEGKRPRYVETLQRASERRERRVASGGVLAERTEIGMPLTGLMNLAETPLLKQVGDLRWAHISEYTGVPSKDLADEDGHRLYSTFFYVDLAFPEDRPMASFGENDRLLFADTLVRYGSSMLDGTTFLLPEDASVERALEFGGVQDAVSDGIPAIRLSNVFVMQHDGAEWLKKSRPANPGFERIPEVSEKPESYLAVKQAQESGHFTRPGTGYVSMANEPIRVDYEIVPDRDLNGAGLLYFAIYPLILDVCEREALQRTRLCLTDDLLDKRTVIRRKSAYLSNASHRDSITVEIEPWIASPWILDGERPEDAPIRLVLNYRMVRQSDGRTMMISTSEKLIYEEQLASLKFFEQLDERQRDRSSFRAADGPLRE